MKKVRLKTVLIMLMTLVVGLQACKKDEVAPAPTIISFAPVSGVAGTTVTIAGSSFSTTIDKNTVTFDGKAATVTAATGIMLTVTVPADAATGKIAVTVGSNSATSATDFTVLMSPTITSFAPASALPGATVTIVGTNFDATLANNTVKFNGIAATVITASTTQLTVTVPAGTANGKITVTVNGLKATAEQDFTIPSPTIKDFSPLNGVIGTTVLINGTNFNTSNVVKFNDAVAIVTAATSTQLTVTVPVGASKGKISVGTAVSSADFTVNPSITSLSASTGAIGKTILINGGGFSAAAANNVVTFNGTTAVVSASTAIQLTVEVPYGATSGPITVTSNGGSPATKDFQVVSAWTQKTDFAGAARSQAIGFAIGGKGYVGGGIGTNNQSVNDLYTFDPTTGSGTWTALASPPVIPSGYSFDCFVIGTSVYTIDGSLNLWQYNTTTNTWSKKVAVPTSTSTAFSFAINDKGYVADNMTGNLSMYDPGLNQFKQLAASFAAPAGVKDFSHAITIGSSIYVVGSSFLYSFDPANGWVQLNAAPVDNFSTTFSIGAFGYARSGTSFWRYNPANDSWTQLEDVVDLGLFQPSFTAGQKAYLSTGHQGVGSKATWEYDPSK